MAYTILANMSNCHCKIVKCETHVPPCRGADEQTESSRGNVRDRRSDSAVREVVAQYITLTLTIVNVLTVHELC